MALPAPFGSTAISEKLDNQSRSDIAPHWRSDLSGLNLVSRVWNLLVDWSPAFRGVISLSGLSRQPITAAGGVMSSPGASCSSALRGACRGIGEMPGLLFPVR